MSALILGTAGMVGSENRTLQSDRANTPNNRTVVE
mgnify:FL=1